MAFDDARKPRAKGWDRLRRRRLALGKARDEACCRCGGPIEWGANGRTHPQAPHVDHLDPMGLGGEELPPLEDLGIAHRACNQSHGAKLGSAKARAMRKGLQVVGPAVEPDLHVTEGADFDVLRDAAAEVAWEGPGARPRLWSPPHPQRAGSYAESWVPWIDEQLAGEGRPPLRWFQRLVLDRGLEHRADGSLCWPLVVLSTGRQLGKSTTIKWLSLARAVLGPAVFAEPQSVLLVARTLTAAALVHRSSWQFAEDRGLHLERRFEASRILWGDGSEFTLSSLRSVFGRSVSLAVADEGWDISETDLHDGLMPTLLARAGGQVWVTSTAHKDCTSLVPSLRRLAASGPDSGVALMEWSIPPDGDGRDLDVYRRWSPYWDGQRENLIRLALRRGDSGAVEQFGNRWPMDEKAAGWPVGWSACAAVDGPAAAEVAAVEQDHERTLWGVALAAPGTEPGTVRLWVHVAASEHEVDELLRAAAPQRVLVGANLGAVLPRWETRRAGARESKAADPLLAALVRDQKLQHNHDPAVAEQTANARTITAESGITVSAKRSVGPVASLRAAAWAVAAVATSPSTTPRIY